VGVVRGEWRKPQVAVDYIASFLDRLTREEVQRYYERYIGPYFTSDGRVDLNVAKHAVDAVATELGVAAASVDQMYQPARLSGPPPWTEKTASPRNLSGRGAGDRPG
jgi:hypothetical protein